MDYRQLAKFKDANALYADFDECFSIRGLEKTNLAHKKPTITVTPGKDGAKSIDLTYDEGLDLSSGSDLRKFVTFCVNPQAFQNNIIPNTWVAEMIAAPPKTTQTNIVLKNLTLPPKSTGFTLKLQSSYDVKDPKYNQYAMESKNYKVTFDDFPDKTIAFKTPIIVEHDNTLNFMFDENDPNFSFIQDADTGIQFTVTMDKSIFNSTGVITMSNFIFNPVLPQVIT